MADLLGSLRRRAWPTRRAFDARLDAVEARLDAVRTQIAELAERLESVSRNLEGQQRRLIEWEAETRTRVRRTQALAARVYEGLGGWPALLAEARAAPDYELPYAERDPLVSIPIPTFHSADTLCERALASVRAQTHSNWEAIVVGDHCTDNTEERVAAIGDPSGSSTCLCGSAIPTIRSRDGP
jgi:Glycosyl transferase family 2